MPVKPGEKRKRTYTKAEIVHVHASLQTCADDLKGFIHTLDTDDFTGELLVDGRAKGLVEAVEMLTGWTDRLRTEYKAVKFRNGMSPDPVGSEPEKALPKRGRRKV